VFHHKKEMQMNKRWAIQFSVVLALVLVLGGATRAQQPVPYPTKPVQFIVPFGAGGATDTLARVTANKLTARLGNTFVVDNRPGGNGNIGTAALAKAAPDGYTIGMGAMSTLAINPAIYKSLAYDPNNAFDPIGGLVSLPIVLVVNLDMPADNLRELITLMKAGGKNYTYGSPGVGNTSHLFGELFKRVVGVDMVHVPYRSGTAVSQDLLAGHLQLSFVTILEALPHIKAGQVRPIAIAWSRRAKELPDVPTLGELGVAGFDSPTWFGVLAPKGTPAAIVNALSAEIKVALADPEVKATLDRLSVEPMPMDPAEFDAFIKAERVKWGELARQSGAQAD
jgi:tripartite-type tricarboxylate transporter receptor subunit TctC